MRPKRSDRHVTVTRDNTRDVTRDQRYPVPSRPDPTTKEGFGYVSALHQTAATSAISATAARPAHPGLDAMQGAGR